MTIALTIALATIVTFYSARLTWQYHRTAAYDRALQRRLDALENMRDVKRRLRRMREN